MAECGAEQEVEEPQEEDKLSGIEKTGTIKTFNPVAVDSPQSGIIPVKDIILKKKITFKVIYPDALQKKDWYLTLQVEEDSKTKKKFRIESFKTNQNHEWTSPSFIFDASKDEALVFNVKERKISFGFMSRVLKSGRFSGLAKYENGTYKFNDLPMFRSIIPDLKILIKIENICETTKLPVGTTITPKSSI